MLDIANCPVYILSKLNIALHAQHRKRSKQMRKFIAIWERDRDEPEIVSCSGNIPTHRVVERWQRESFFFYSTRKAPSCKYRVLNSTDIVGALIEISRKGL